MAFFWRGDIGYKATLHCFPNERVILVEFDATAPDWRDQYKLMVGQVRPRPIALALVTPLGRYGPSAEPFSCFNAVG